MAKVINCGFARALVLFGVSTYPSYYLFDRIYNDYESLFEKFPNFWTHEKRELKQRFKKYQQFIKSSKVDPALKLTVISSFSDQEWKKLSDETKSKHSLQDCKVRNLHNAVY